MAVRVLVGKSAVCVLVEHNNLVVGFDVDVVAVQNTSNINYINNNSDDDHRKLDTQPETK